MQRSWLLGLLLAAACPHRSLRADPALGEAAVVPIDAAWEARSTDGLDPVWEAVANVPEALRDAPQVLAQVARLEVAEGLAADDPLASRRAFARARAAGMRCLGQDPAFEAALQQRRPARGLAGLAAERVSCAVWTGYAWARWAVGFEPSAVTLDVELVDALLAQGERGEPELARVARWGQALAHLRRPVEAGGRPAQAQEDLARMLEQEPGDDDWVRYEDVVRLAPRVQVTPPTRAPRSPEERAAARRVLGAVPSDAAPLEPTVAP